MTAMQKPIYLDYMSTTPVDPAVAEKMWQYLTPEGEFGNPASVTHAYGWRAKEAVDAARAQVAALINAAPKEIIWTSGCTEANNLAIKGVAEFYANKGKHIITAITEHKAVLDPCHYLKQQGYDVTVLPVGSDGLLDLTQLDAAIRDDTLLVSIMHVNNEIGVIQDIKAIGDIAHKHNVLFHVDAAQSAGKVPIDMQQMSVDLLSLASHKIYGPKGIGALYVRRKPRARLSAQIHGGGHELGLRSGTLPTHQIVGMGEAFAIAKQQLANDTAKIADLRDLFWQQLSDMEGIEINGSIEHRIAGILNIHIKDTEGESLLTALQPYVALSSGSACTSATIEPSHVLTAIGLSNEAANNSLRISIGRFTTEEDILQGAKLLREKITWLRAMMP